MTPDAVIPAILFGAFDRHNLGDLLFPHITAAMLAGEHLIFAGLAERDLSCHGGHRVRAQAQLAANLGDRPANIIHVGGELLTCEAWQAAVMLLPPDQVQQTLLRLDRHPEARQAWARSKLGTAALAPYTLPRSLFHPESRIIYNGVGGVELGRCDAAMRTEVLANLQAANAVGVRDKQTLAHLQEAGITARLIPDPVVMLAELFGEKIRRRTQGRELAGILTAFPQGYIAVQFSADFGTDATLIKIATQLDDVTSSTGYGVVFFRAGAVPWHDELLCYQRVAARMHTPSVKIFTSLNIWDICALIACSRVYCGSSLHGRIVAMAFAMPRISLIHPDPANRPAKQAAFAATWEKAGMPATAGVNEIAHGIRQALSVDPGQLQQIAGELVEHYRHGFDVICAELKYPR